MEQMQQYYPLFNLEDKVNLNGGGNVITGKSVICRMPKDLKEAHVRRSRREKKLNLKLLTQHVRGRILIAGQMCKRERWRSVRWEDFIYT